MVQHGESVATLFEKIPGDGGLCRGCGGEAHWRIMWAIGPRIGPEKVDLCEGCVVELERLATKRAAYVLALQGKTLPR